MQPLVTTNHRTFLALLDASDQAVWAVGYWLWRKGYEVRLNPMTKAPTAGDWQKHSDNGDLLVRLPGNQDWVRVEVKHRKVKFTSRDDFPYPTMMVCSKHSFDRADPKPYAYIMLNNDMTHMAIITTATCDKWLEEEFGDKNFGGGYRQMKYVCPKEHIHFSSFDTKEQ